MQKKLAQTAVQLLFTIATITAIVMGLVMLALQHRIDPSFILYFSLIPFFLFSIGLSGMLLHYFDLHHKFQSTTYPLFIGALFVLLLVLHLFIVLPLICPGFPH